MKKEENPSLNSLGEPWAKVSRELAYLEILNDVKNILGFLTTKVFFTYQRDLGDSDLYHLYYNDTLCFSTHFQDEKQVESFIKALEFAAMKGSAYSLEVLIDKMQNNVAEQTK
jgi:hypothetical protein